MAEPLYLKYRPQKLAELVGQEIIAITLGNALKLNKVAHAYFFTGPRGCGKTSTARILAKSLNCKQGPTLDPCGVCTNCQEISAGISPDVIEIDAASHRSVEDAAQVIERCHLASQTASFKIYIFDEVHMLSKEAFNALLKTIEEPPAQVVFILATTEEHKVPATIVSRCQKFSFKPIDVEPLTKRLKQVSDLENIKLTESSYAKIAKQSRGGLRDALSLLDQISILGSEGELIEEKLILDLLGALSEQALNELLNCLCQKQAFEALEKTNEFLSQGVDAVQLLRALVEFAIEKLEKQNKDNSLIQVIEHLCKNEYSVRSASQPALRFKSLILSISFSSNNDNTQNIDLSPLIQRIEQLESKLNSNNFTSQTNKITSQTKSSFIQSEPHLSESSDSAPQKPNFIKENSNFTKQIPQPEPNIEQKSSSGSLIDILLTELTHIPTKTLIRDSKAFIISQTSNSAIIGIPAKGFYDKLNDPKRISIIQETLSKRLGQNFTIKLELNSSQKPPEAKSQIPELKPQPLVQEFKPELSSQEPKPIILQTETIAQAPQMANSEDEENIFEIAKHILGAKPIAE